MRNRSKILNLSAAVTALIAPSGLVVQTADATPTSSPNDTTNHDQAGPKTTLRVGEDLMSFTVGENPEGIVVAQHESHASHASHASHSSGM
jgi:hypothetical protein